VSYVMSGIMIRQEMGQGYDAFVTRIRLDSGEFGEVARGRGRAGSFSRPPEVLAKR
jgi:hypothetical protein